MSSILREFIVQNKPKYENVGLIFLPVSSSCFFKKQHILCRQPTILLLSFVAVVLIKLSEFIFHFRLLSSVTSGMFHSWNFEANTFVECFGYIFLLVGSLLSLNQAGCEEGYFKF